MRNRGQKTTAVSSHQQSLSAEVEEPTKFTLGKQHFSPIQYNNFEVGPIVITLHPVRKWENKVERAENYGEMQARATDILEAMFDEEFERRTNAYLDKMVELGKLVKDHRASR